MLIGWVRLVQNSLETAPRGTPTREFIKTRDWQEQTVGEVTADYTKLPMMKRRFNPNGRVLFIEGLHWDFPRDLKVVIY